MIVKKGKQSELYAALVDQLKKAEMTDDEFTIQDFAEDLGVGRAAAHATIQKLIAGGTVTQRDARKNGKVIKAYTIIK